MSYGENWFHSDELLSLLAVKLTKVNIANFNILWSISEFSAYIDKISNLYTVKNEHKIVQHHYL